MGYFCKLRFLTFTSLIALQVFPIAQGQTPLQVEFDRGTPLARDPVPASELNIPSNGILNDVSKEWRLPLDIEPTEYDISITPILTDDTTAPGALWEVPGHVIITFKAITNTSSVVLHSKDINITSYNVII